ncbi:MAG: YraN family protein [Clostridiales bacterium]|jgi:putative endonuclease|nr:YraN family protein [Clostridiales bacterium]
MVSLGRQGEELAAAYLVDKGYQILVRNWRCRHGEIDLVAMDGKTMVFIEVKTRRTVRLGLPAEAVDIRKQERLRSLARRYIYETGQTAGAYRFDVVAVTTTDNSITLIQNAF